MNKNIILPAAGVLLLLQGCAANKPLATLPPKLEEPAAEISLPPVRLESPLLKFFIEVPAKAAVTPVIWDMASQKKPGFITPKPAAARQSFQTGFSIKMEDSEVIVRATSAEQGDKIPAWEYDLFDSPSSTGNYEELVSSSPSVSIAGVTGVEAYRASESQTVRLKYGITGPIYQFRLDTPLKISDKRLLSVIIFPSPASRNMEQAAALAKSIAASFSYTAKERSTYNEDDYGKTVEVKIPAALTLTLPAQESCLWTPEQNASIRFSKETKEAARSYWSMTIKTAGEYEINFLCLKTGETEPALRYNLRVRAQK